MISALAAAGLLVGAAGATAAAGDIGGGDVDSSSAPSSTAAAPADPGTGASTDGTTDSVAPPVHVPHLDGDVSAVNTGSILITDHEGFTRTINVSDATTYGDGIALPIEVGEHIHAEGSVAADGTSLDATAISLAPEPPAPGTAGRPVVRARAVRLLRPRMAAHRPFRSRLLTAVPPPRPPTAAHRRRLPWEPRRPGLPPADRQAGPAALSRRGRRRPPRGPLPAPA